MTSEGKGHLGEVCAMLQSTPYAVCAVSQYTRMLYLISHSY